MKLERFKEKKKINIVIITIFILLLITGGFILGTTYSKYRYETEEIPFINGKLKYSIAGSDVIFAFYIDGKSETTMPAKDTGYMYDADNSKCDKDATIKWDSVQWAPTILNLTQTRTTCEIHFNQRNSFGDEIILADQPGSTNVGEAKEKIKLKTAPSFSKTSTTDEGLFMVEDDLGESYYFRGTAPDNWVKFAGYYWRIIRVNGDGTVRMIYNGKDAGTGLTPTESDTQIQTSAFHSNYNNPKYVGYMWGDYDSNQKIYANSSPSTIKEVLDTWYKNNLDTQYGKYIANEIFCNDRKVASGNGATGSNQYGTYARLYTGKNPSLQCENINDRFAVKTTEGSIVTRIGDLEVNEALTYPVGLITADEVSMAGGVYLQNNQKYYLYTNSDYWTMTPCRTNSSGSANVWLVPMNGSLNGDSSVDRDVGVRPVINIKANITVAGGNGTSDEPYTLKLD